MTIGDVIRKYRKQKDMTQEDVALRLGVTTPAVCKWESGSAMPDITLLAPIARLLDVSLNELLSFREELTAREIRELTETLQGKLQTEDYEQVFAWAQRQMEEFPNCEALLYNFSVLLDGARAGQCPENRSRHDHFIFSCYERLLKSSNETLRLAGADALFNHYYKAEQYDKAQTCLSCFSDQNPEKKRKQACLYEQAGQTTQAYRAYEEILFSGYQMLSVVLHSMTAMAVKAGDIPLARYYTEKHQAAVRLFEMGDYNLFAAEIDLMRIEKDPDRTLAVARGLLDHADALCHFETSPLYAHMVFHQTDQKLCETLKQGILESLKTDEALAHMQNDPRWQQLIAGDSA